MTLLNPFGLIGLFSLPVILALHLLFKRQRRHIVSNLELWSFLDTQARGPQVRRIPITWILIADLLIGLLLTLAWTQPRIALSMPVQAPRNLVILMDVSTSMQARSGVGQATRLDQAKSEAAALLNNVQSHDVVTILGFGRQARTIADSRQNDLAYLAEQVRTLKVGETGSTLRETLALGEAALDKQLPVEFHIITDGDFALENAGDLSVFAHPLQWHLVGDTVDNQAVVELNATPLGSRRLQVFTRLANFSSQPVAREAALEVDGRQVDRAVIEIPADSSIPHVWQFPISGDRRPTQVTVALRGEDPLPEDDSAAIGLQSGGAIRVALVSESTGAVQQAAQAIPGVDLQHFVPADYPNILASQRSAYDLTILDNFIPEQWPAGRVLVVNPPAGNAGTNTGTTADISLVARSAREIPANAVVQAPSPDPIVEGIDFNGVRWARIWSLQNTPSGFVTILQANDVPILLRGEISQAQAEPSQVVVLLADLNRGNFTKHAAFPVLVANIIENARQAPLPPGFQTGEPLPLPAPGSYSAIQLTPPGQASINLEGDWPAEWTQTLDPGLYLFRLIQADGEDIQFASGARAGDSMESDLRMRGWAEAVRTGAAPANQNVHQRAQPVDLREWLLGAAIVLLVVEAILAWRR